VRPPEACESLEDVRQAIDGLDREILHLLGSRTRYVAAAARFKTDPKGVHAPERQKAMLARRREWAEEEGLDPDFVETLYQNIVSHFVGREMDHWQVGNA
jgi:isochorismate pyruvate lyase